MAGGFTKDGAVQDQIDSSLKDAVDRVRNQLPSGESATHCEECGLFIPEARRTAMQGVRLCVSCQESADAMKTAFAGYNRRGSKDSQLR
ncbi:MAG: phage/conjugal plasmid C-4 type zinc finger TraR family protein [Gammaproteobacteria bacterium]|jgi:phage/conjugal plasmid C-4 type zinc finger TraR family protein